MRQPGPRVSLSPSPSLFLAALFLSVSLHSLSYSCLLFNGPRRCSLIDGTGHGRTAARKKERGNRREKEKESKRTRRGGAGKDEWEEGEGASLWTTIALFIMPGITEFTIKIPRSAALMDHRAPRDVATTPVFSNEPAPFSSWCLRTRERERERGSWGMGWKPAVLPLSSSRSLPLSPPLMLGWHRRIPRGNLLPPQRCLRDSISIYRCSFLRSIDSEGPQDRILSRCLSKTKRHKLKEVSKINIYIKLIQLKHLY